MVGNGHRLRNSSMGETINTYDVVIRYSPGHLCDVHPCPVPPTGAGCVSLAAQCPHVPCHLSPCPRLNNAPVHGYEQDVGSKTTMRLFYPESAHFNPRTENNPDTLLVLVPFKPMDFQWMEAILNDKKRASVVGNWVHHAPNSTRAQLCLDPTHRRGFSSYWEGNGHLHPLAGSKRVLEAAPTDLGCQPGAGAHSQPVLHGSYCC